MCIRYFKYRTPMRDVSLVISQITEDVFVIRCNDNEETAGSFAEAEAFAYYFHKEYVGDVYTLLQ